MKKNNKRDSLQLSQLETLSTGRMLVYVIFILLCVIIFGGGFALGSLKLYITYGLLYSSIWIVLWGFISWYLCGKALVAKYDTFLVPHMKAPKSKPHTKSK